MLECKYETVKSTTILKEGSQSLEIQGELILPEGFPDIEEIHVFHGYPSGVLGEIADGTLSLYGQVETHLIYQGAQTPEKKGEYGVVWKGENGISFEEKIHLPELNAQWDWETDIAFFSLEAVSPRKVRYSGEVTVRLKGKKDLKFPVISEVKTEADIETVKDRVIIHELVAVAQTSKEVKNQYQLIYPKPPLARVVDAVAVPVGVNTLVSKGQVTVEGFLEVSLVYISRDIDGNEAGVEVSTWNQQNGGVLPFQIKFDIPQAASEQIAVPKVWVESVEVSSGYPENCRFQAMLGARVELLNPKSVEVVLDLTARKDDVIDVLRRSHEIEEIIGVLEKDLVIEQTLTLPVGSCNLERVLLISSSPRLLECQTDLDRVFIEGEAEITLLYLGEDEEGEKIEAACWNRRSGETVTFGEFLEMPGTEEKMIAAVKLSQEGLRIEETDERAVKLVLELKARVLVRGERSLSFVEDCALIRPKDESRPSMLFYLAQPGDSLWKVARRYNTTMATIAKANNIEDLDGVLPCGRKLLIPKKLLVK